MNITLIIIAVLIAAVVIWLLLFRKQNQAKPVAYVCDQCGELHCDCHRRDTDDTSDRD